MLFNKQIIYLILAIFAFLSGFFADNQAATEVEKLKSGKICAQVNQAIDKAPKVVRVDKS